MPTVPVLSHDAVLAAVSPTDANERTREAFLRHRAGEWSMPPKTYLQSPPHGDFRAMPALGDGFAMLKWISSFPGNPERGIATVQGIVVLSDAETSVPLALVDARAVTALRTGAIAAVATRALAPEGARTVGVVGAGLHGRWAARCMVAAGYGPGVAADPRAEAAEGLATELDGWRAGSLEEALAQDVVCCVTPGGRPVVEVASLHPGLHLNMLGADGPGKAEATVEAVESCVLFCDQWEQASHGGELTAAVDRGAVTRDMVSDLGAVLTGESPGRPDAAAVTLFDSTGLAIQDLAIAIAAFRAWESGAIQAPSAEL